jgi:dUTP pyrophosphatase
MNVNIKLLSEDAVLPTYSKDGDAGMDIVATRIDDDTYPQITYGTDIAIEIPSGYVGLIFPRSSIRNFDLELSNSVGVIDSGYRGEIKATFNKTIRARGKYYHAGDRIMQLIIIPYPQIKFNEVDELTKTVRNEGGYGSTGR